MNIIKNFFNKEIAVILDDTGYEIERVVLNRQKNIFNYGSRAYNIDRLNAFGLKIKTTFFNKKYFFYNLNCSTPLSFSVNSQTLVNNINPEIYNIYLKNEIIKALNQPNGESFFSKLKPEQVIMVLGIIGAIIYIMKNGLN